MTSCYLVHGDVVRDPKIRPLYSIQSVYADLDFSGLMRAGDVDLFVSNVVDFGHILPDNVIRGKYVLLK